MKYRSGLQAAIVGIAATVFLLFVYGYPRLFPQIEASNPDHFEKNVAEAIAKGDVREALRIARRATHERRRDPMAYTVYGRVLLERGEANEALDQLAKAFALRMEPLPSRQATQKPYYFAPARLTLGAYYLEQNSLPEAVENFELARAYAALADIKYSNFHAALYEAYARQGLWARALEFGEPSGRELDDLDGQDLVRIGRICEGNQNWKLASQLAERLLTRDGFTSEAHYLLGRVALAQGHHELSLAHLEQADLHSHADAAFFLGKALENNGQAARAIQIFLSVPYGNVYRPFALAKAWTLVEDYPEGELTSSATRKQELLDQLDRELAAMRLLQPPVLYDAYRRFAPVAVITSTAHFAAGGHFPILILWEDGKAPVTDPTHMVLSSTGPNDTPLLLERGNSVLQLQWVENLVNWEGVERLQEDGGVVPGWIDVMRDWFGLRPDYVAEIQQDDAGNRSLNINKLTWLYSVPFRVQHEVGYLLAGRMKGPPGKVSLKWQAMDEAELVQSEGGIVAKKGPDAWSWQGAYMRSRLYWDAMRVILDAMPNAGAVAFDDIMLVELTEPDYL